MDKISGYWIGQCVGNYMGFPFEGTYLESPVPVFIDRYYQFDDDTSLLNRTACDLMSEGFLPPETGSKAKNENWYTIDPQLVNEIWSMIYPGLKYIPRDSPFFEGMNDTADCGSGYPLQRRKEIFREW